jgi:hypothetical protein
MPFIQLDYTAGSRLLSYNSSPIGGAGPPPSVPFIQSLNTCAVCLKLHGSKNRSHDAWNTPVSMMRTANQKCSSTTPCTGFAFPSPDRDMVLSSGAQSKLESRVTFRIVTPTASSSTPCTLCCSKIQQVETMHSASSKFSLMCH